MRILFDQGTPVPLRAFLEGHGVSTAHEMRWANLKNGDLISRAEASFDRLITTDKNLRYQQNLAERTLAILVLPTTNWAKLKDLAVGIAAAVAEVRPGEYREFEM